MSNESTINNSCVESHIIKNLFAIEIYSD